VDVMPPVDVMQPTDVQFFDEIQPDDMHSFGSTDVLDYVDASAPPIPLPIDLPVVDVFEPVDIGAPQVMLAPEESPSDDLGGLYLEDVSSSVTSLEEEISFDVFE